MIRKIHLEQVVEVLSVLDPSRRTVTTDEPSLAWCGMPSAELQREEVLEPPVKLLPMGRSRAS